MTVSLARPDTGIAVTPAEGAGTPRITIAVVPQGVGPAKLGKLRGAAVGLLNPGLGDVPPAQTWLDVSQGARAFDSSYDTPLGNLSIAPRYVLGWEKVLLRASSTSTAIKPGLLAAAMDRNGLEMVHRTDAGKLALSTADRAGRLVPAPETCPGPLCDQAVTVTRVSLDGARQMAERRDANSMLIVIESPPADSGDQLAMAVAAPGFGGMLESESTRTPGYVLTTDIGPTILDFFGIRTPKAMTGLPIGSGGQVDYRALNELEGRYQQVGKRRGAALLVPLLIWTVIAAAAIGLTRGRFAPAALKLLTLSTVLLPAALLFTASFSPSLETEQAIATILPAVVGAVLLRFLPGYRALAAACLLTVGPYAIDMLAGSVLTPKAVVGPNPGLGARFYGIGNELESSLMILTSVGVGAALATWGGGLGEKRSAAAFLIAGLAGTIVFAAGRFGADVGAAIIFPIAAVIAAALVANRPRLAWMGGLVALAALILVAIADMLLGGESHYVRALFDGSSGDSVGQVLAHRVTETAASFTRLSRLPITLAAFALILLAWRERRRIASWLDPVPAVKAAVIAAAIASAVGAASNDSGALFIQVGVLFLGLVIGFSWAEANKEADT
ncbi:MAG TPA: hypothetical protein VMF31_09615 [Solirubrobacterales bacterium]|nr:hypothetical protein [Solirubrobacterales bacterium]